VGSFFAFLPHKIHLYVIEQTLHVHSAGHAMHLLFGYTLLGYLVYANQWQSFILDHPARQWILASVILATALDAAVHYWSKQPVDLEYYTNKIVVASSVMLAVWQLLDGYLHVESPALVCLLLAVPAVLLLQIRYTLEGYSQAFLRFFLQVHLLAFFASLYVLQIFLIT
jgi:hypothetical protein